MLLFCVSVPGGLLLQPGHLGNVEHHPEDQQRLVAELVQLLLQWFLQVNPSLLVLLVVVPKAEECYLGRKGQGNHISYLNMIVHI
jgi:hypothetical protein